jgi:hypothetical protein
MAVKEGFEPSIPIKVCTLSRGVVSATHPLHRTGRHYTDLTPDLKSKITLYCLYRRIFQSESVDKFLHGEQQRLLAH